jgi:hypothetical protein
MEPHGQSPWFPRDAPQGANIPYQGPIHPRVEPVVLLVRDSCTAKYGSRSLSSANDHKIYPAQKLRKEIVNTDASFYNLSVGKGANLWILI